MTYTTPNTQEAEARAALRPEQLLLAGGAFADILLSEALATWVDLRLGLGLYALLLLALLWHAAFTGQDRVRRLCLALSLVPLMRVIALGLPLARLPAFIQMAAVAVPLLVGALLVLRRMQVPLTQQGWSLGQRLSVSFWYALMPLSGIGFGIVEVATLRSRPVVPDMTVPGLVAALLLLAVGVGLLEEIVFRGLILHAYREIFGTRAAVLYVALLGTVLQIGYGSLAHTALAFVFGLWLGWVTLRMRTFYPAALAHALAAVVVYLVLPMATRL